MIEKLLSMGTMLIKYNSFLKILRKDSMNSMNIMNPPNPRIKLSKYTSIHMHSH